MCGGMISDGIDACYMIDFRGEFLPDFQSALDNLADVNVGLALFLCITHFEDNAISNKLTFIPDLSTGFSIERCSIENHSTIITCFQFSNGPAVLVKCSDLAFLLQQFIAAELG